MSQRIKALKDKLTGKIVYLFLDNTVTFSSPDHDLVTVEIKEIISGLCQSCTGYNSCTSGLRGKDQDCSSYTTDAPDLQQVYEAIDYTILKSYNMVDDDEYSVTFLYPGDNKAYKLLLKAREILKAFKK